jgi:hypothetical protein
MRRSTQRSRYSSGTIFSTIPLLSFIAEALVQIQTSQCGICHGRTASGTNFSPSTSSFLYECHPTKAQNSSTHLSLTFPQYRILGSYPSRCGFFGETRTLLLLPGIDVRYLNFPTLNLTIILSDVSWL